VDRDLSLLKWKSSTSDDNENKAKFFVVCMDFALWVLCGIVCGGEEQFENHFPKFIERYI